MPSFTTQLQTWGCQIKRVSRRAQMRGTTSPPHWTKLIRAKTSTKCARSVPLDRTTDADKSNMHLRTLVLLPRSGSFTPSNPPRLLTRSIPGARRPKWEVVREDFVAAVHENRVEPHIDEWRPVPHAQHVDKGIHEGQHEVARAAHNQAEAQRPQVLWKSGEEENKRHARLKEDCVMTEREQSNRASSRPAFSSPFPPPSTPPYHRPLYSSRLAHSQALLIGMTPSSRENPHSAAPSSAIGKPHAHRRTSRARGDLWTRRT